MATPPASAANWSGAGGLPPRRAGAGGRTPRRSGAAHRQVAGTALVRGGPAFEPQILAAENVIDGYNVEAGAGQGGRQRGGREERAVLIEEVPGHPRAQDPLDARRLEEDAGGGGSGQGAPHRPQQRQRFGDVLDDVR